MSNIAEPKRTPDEVNFLNPLVWAYVGDSVYELFIRTNLVNNSNEKVHKLHSGRLAGRLLPELMQVSGCRSS